jgi:hypothetical protein
MRCASTPDRDSIFGNTYCGVPNPLAPVRHPYPTRFHGRVPFQPQSFFPYRQNPYARAPYLRGPKPMQPWESMGGGATAPTLVLNPLEAAAMLTLAAAGVASVVALPPECRTTRRVIGATFVGASVGTLIAYLAAGVAARV